MSEIKFEAVEAELAKEKQRNIDNYNIKNWVGERIRFLRKKQNLTQKQLSHKTNLCHTYISLIEQGKRDPTLTTLSKILHSLDAVICLGLHHCK